MIPAHEKCPICHCELRHSKYINKHCLVLNKKISYVESVCNQPDVMSDNKSYPIHLFFQVCSLYGELLYQKVQLITHYFEADINYPLHKSSILIFGKPDIYATVAVPPDIINMDNRLLEFDFPQLEKLINKANTCKLFL